MTVSFGFRTRQMYGVREAARLARTSPRNVRRWLWGSAEIQPVLHHSAPGEGPQLSFLDLVELIVVARFRVGEGRRVPLDRLRRAHRFARERLGIDHPFASSRFRIEGGHVMHEFEEAEPGPGRLAVDLDGQYVLPGDLGEAMDLFEFEDAGEGLATRWLPAGRDGRIVVDPDFSAGAPSVEGANVRTATIAARFGQGWSIDEIAADFELDPQTVEAALRFEGSFAAAA